MKQFHFNPNIIFLIFQLWALVFPPTKLPNISQSVQTIKDILRQSSTASYKHLPFQFDDLLIRMPILFAHFPAILNQRSDRISTVSSNMFELKNVLPPEEIKKNTFISVPSLVPTYSNDQNLSNKSLFR